MRRSDFDLRALYDALDAQRIARGISWAALAREVNRFRAGGHPVAASTITGLRVTRVGEGDGILQMLLWLGRTPESFVPGVADPSAPRFRLPALTREQVLRWDTPALFSALNEQRQERGLTWAEVAGEIGGCTPGMLTNLSKGGRVGFPHVMRLVRWLDRPAVTFTRSAR